MKMVSEKTEEKIVPAVRPVAYVVGAVFIIAMTSIQSWWNMFVGTPPFGAIGENWWPGQIGLLHITLFWVIVFGLILALLPKSVSLNVKEVVVVMAMIFLTATGANLAPIGLNTAPATWAASADPWGKYVRDSIDRFGPSYFSIYSPDPRDLTQPVWRDLIFGRTSFFTYLGVWAPSLAFKAVWMLSLMFTFLFLGAIFRRQFIDLENMAFPYGLAVTEVAKSAGERGSRAKIFTAKWLWLGILVGLLSDVLLWLDFILPGVVNMPNFGAKSFLTLEGNYFIPGNYSWALAFSFDTFAIGIALLAPTSVMASTFIWTTFLWVILPPIATMSGFFRPIRWMGACGVWMGQLRQYGPLPEWWQAAAGGGTWSLQWGLMGGYILVPLIIYRKQFIESLKAIAKPNPEVEKNEPLPYRWLWIGFAVSVLINAVLYIPATAGILGGVRFIGVLLFSVSWYVIIYWAGMRLGGETGNFSQMDNHAAFQSHQMGIRSGWFGNAMPAIGGKNVVSAWYLPHETPEKTIALNATRMPLFGTGYSSGQEAVPGIGRLLLDTFKMAQLTETPTKPIFIGAFVAALTLVISGPFIKGTIIYWYGVKVIGGNPWGSNTMMSHGGSELCCFRETPPTWWIFVGAGMLAIIINYALIALLPGLPIPHPAGLVLASTAMPAWIWIPSLIGYLGRRIALRVGGASVYEKKVVPFAVGLIAAYAFVNAILWTWRAYVVSLTW